MGMQYRLVVKDRKSEKIEYANWFNTEEERRTHFQDMVKSDSKQYLIEKKEVPPYDPTEPPSGEWRTYKL